MNEMNKQMAAINGQRTRPPRLSESDGGQATVNGERTSGFILWSFTPVYPDTQCEA